MGQNVVVVFWTALQLDEESFGYITRQLHYNIQVSGQSESEESSKCLNLYVGLVQDK